MTNLIARPTRYNDLQPGEGGYISLKRCKLSFSSLVLLHPLALESDAPHALVERGDDGTMMISSVSEWTLPVEQLPKLDAQTEEMVIAAPNRVEFERRVNAALSSGEGWTVKTIVARKGDTELVAVLRKGGGNG